MTRPPRKRTPEQVAASAVARAIMQAIPVRYVEAERGPFRETLEAALIEFAAVVRATPARRPGRAR